MLKPTIQSLDRVKEVVEFGVENGIKTKGKNGEGKTAMELALEKKQQLVESVRRTVETDSRYGIDSRPFLKRYQTKFDLVVKLLEGVNVVEGGGESSSSSSSSAAAPNSLSSRLKSFARGFVDNSKSNSMEEEHSIDLSGEAPIECSICLENQPNTALDPCGHTVCQSCSNELSVCPYCRTIVKKTLRIYRWGKDEIVSYLFLMTRTFLFLTLSSVDQLCFNLFCLFLLPYTLRHRNYFESPEIAVTPFDFECTSPFDNLVDIDCSSGEPLAAPFMDLVLPADRNGTYSCCVGRSSCLSLWMRKRSCTWQHFCDVSLYVCMFFSYLYH